MPISIALVDPAENLGYVRIALLLVLVAAIALGAVSVALPQSRILGFTGMTLVLISTLMGGSWTSSRNEGSSDVYFALDFFLLNLILLSTIFIPIERLFKKRDQPIFRGEWREDLFYFFISSLFVQSLTYMSLTSALTVLAGTSWASGLREMLARGTASLDTPFRPAIGDSSSILFSHD